MSRDLCRLTLTCVRQRSDDSCLLHHTISGLGDKACPIILSSPTSNVAPSPRPALQPLFQPPDDNWPLPASQHSAHHTPPTTSPVVVALLREQARLERQQQHDSQPRAVKRGAGRQAGRVETARAAKEMAKTAKETARAAKEQQRAQKAAEKLAVQYSKGTSAIEGAARVACCHDTRLQGTGQLRSCCAC